MFIKAVSTSFKFTCKLKAVKKFIKNRTNSVIEHCVEGNVKTVRLSYIYLNHPSRPHRKKTVKSTFVCISHPLRCI